MGRRRSLARTAAGTGPGFDLVSNQGLTIIRPRIPQIIMIKIGLDGGQDGLLVGALGRRT